jgi:hypothetical protein
VTVWVEDWYWSVQSALVLLLLLVFVFDLVEDLDLLATPRPTP